MDEVLSAGKLLQGAKDSRVTLPMADDASLRVGADADAGGSEDAEPGFFGQALSGDDAPGVSFAERFYSAVELLALLPLPKATSHKYSRGKAVVIGGSAVYPGAACLAAAASQRMGAGYTEVLCAPESVAIARSYRPSLVVRSWESLSSESFSPTREGRPIAYAVGSGMDSSAEGFAETKRLVYSVLKHAKAPVLVDGGGLSALPTDKGRRLLRRRFLQGWPTVITPHGGEAARLAKPLNLSDGDPGRLAGLLSLAYGAVVVLKGSVTFISDGEAVYRMGEGTAALAKAGTGDVLAGIVGALLAQGLAPFDAAALGAVLHARAGRAAAQRLTDICVTAEDVVEALPEAVAAMHDADARSERPFRLALTLRERSRRMGFVRG